MANIKSAEKRIRQAGLQTARNRAVRSRLRSTIKKYRSAEDKPKDLPGTYSQIDRALRKGVVHKNAAARYKSRLAKMANAKTPVKNV